MKPTPQELTELMRLRGSPVESYLARSLEDTRNRLMNCNDADIVKQLQGTGRHTQEILRYIREDLRELPGSQTGKRLL